MTDLSVTEGYGYLPEDDEQDRAVEDYAEPQAPYLNSKDDLAVKRSHAYTEASEKIDRGVAKVGNGTLDQLDGFFNIWKYNLWNTQGFRNLDAWLDDYLVFHRVTVIDTRSGIGRTTFFQMMKAVAKSLAVGMEYREALRIGLNHGALEEMENSGAVRFEVISGHGGKKTREYLPVVTPVGEEKLLKDGLVSLKQYMDSLSSMTGREAVTTVRHDVGREYTYCSLLKEYRSDTPLFDESRARTFAMEFRHVDPANGETPYQAKLIIPDDIPDNVVHDILKKWKYNYEQGGE